MISKKRKSKRSDGPSPFEHTDKRFIPLPYNGRSPNGRRTWIPDGTIAFKIDNETYHVSGFPLAEILATQGIHTGEPATGFKTKR
jgi:hypothetical protein